MADETRETREENYEQDAYGEDAPQDVEQAPEDAEQARAGRRRGTLAVQGAGRRRRGTTRSPLPSWAR